MKRRTILSSILVIIACIAVISGTTFALFTSESSVNIAISSGKVNVVATLDTLKCYSATADTTISGLDTSDKNVAGTITSGPFAGTYYYQGPLANNEFTNGGTAEIEPNQLLTLDRVTPGDKVTVRVNIENNSNVKIQYRIRVNVVEGNNAVESLKLFSGLKTKIDGTEFSDVIRVTEWKQLGIEENPEEEDNLADVPVEIYLPLEAGNEYQNLRTQIKITVEAVQSNAHTASLDEINTILATSTAKNNTMYDAIQEVIADANSSYVEDDFYPYVWNVDTDRFYDESSIDGNFFYKYFKAYNAMPDVQTYSIYAIPNQNWTAPVSGLKVGFDAGNATGITSVTYDRSDATDGRDVVIRTNSASTTLTIDAALDTVKHYGAVGSLNIIAVANASYHEYGKAAFAEIATGRIVLESNSEIKHIHINANENANGFEEVIIKDNGAEALPEKITRDQVDVSEAKAVVTVETGSTSETVYVYPYTDAQETKTGTTEKTTTQNTTIATALGTLVLDNGSDAGEKAMSNNEKTSAKQEVVEVAQNEEAIEKAEEAGYDVTPHEAKAPSCTEVGYYAYDSYEVNGEVVKIGYKEIPALGHQKAENPSYQHAFSAAHWQHATQCVVDSEWIVEDCVDLNNDNYCDICNQQMYVLVYTSSNLHTNSKYPSAIWNGAYKLMDNVSLDTMSRIYGDVVIDLNGYTLSNYSINSPADTQFMSYSNANAIYTLTLRDSSISKTGMFMSRFGDTFFDGSGNSGNNRFILNCEDGVTINTSFNYQGTEMDSFAYTGGYFINNASKDIIIRNAHLVIGGIAHVNSGYTITFENCVIESRQSSGFLQSGSGNIVYDGCTITTVMQSSSGNVLDSSSPNVTYTNETTVNGVTK